ncbi:hypothetical protein [Tateyamaria sp.]|uniref:hypothetical protein n=1 Tax=Tateyamaria sp. TaxID=1929288 RepID=UPI00329AF27C
MKDNTDNTPTPLTFDAATLGTVLGDRANLPGFLVWRAFYGDGDGTFSKRPVDPEDGRAKPPNTARDRAILTLDQAIEAATKLRDEMGLPCGVGCFATKAGLLAIDLDDCVENDVIAEWALGIIEGSYAEKSPSGGGLRCLVSADGLPEALAKMTNGLERMSLGLYGENSNKFVTLTGNAIPNAAMAIEPLSVGQQNAIWAQWAKSAQTVSNNDFAAMYPPGEQGLALAFLDIATGSSLHPATIAYVAKAAGLNMYRSQCREELIAAHQEFSEVIETLTGQQRQEQEARWHKRFHNSIEGALEWIDGSGGWPTEVTTQDRQAARTTVDALRREKSAETTTEAAQAGVEGHTYSKGTQFNNVAATIPPAEWADLRAIYGEDILIGLCWDDMNEIRTERLLEVGADVPRFLQETDIYAEHL